MKTVTISVPNELHARLSRMAAEDGLTIAQELELLMDRAAPRPKPTFGGYRSGKPYSAEQIDDELSNGFGEW